MPGPTVWGVYDYWLGGHSHLRADRDLGQQIAARWPSIPVLVRAAHDFHLRAAAWCMDYGITRFVRLGSATYLPDRSITAAARRAHPDLRAVYVLREDSSYAMAKELLAGPGITVVQAEAERPQAVLAAPPAAQMLAEGEPAALLIAMVAHFAAPAKAAADMAQYIAALPPGSAVIISAMVTADRAEAREFRRMFTPWPIHPWTVRDVGRMLDGLELVPPGVARAGEWPAGTQWAGPPLTGKIPVRVAGAVAVKAIQSADGGTGAQRGRRGRRPPWPYRCGRPRTRLQ